MAVAGVQAESIGKAFAQQEYQSRVYVKYVAGAGIPVDGMWAKSEAQIPKGSAARIPNMHKYQRHKNR